VIIDSSICVAVMTIFPRRFVSSMIALLPQRDFLGPELHAEIAARDHDAVGDVDDLGESIERLRLLDLRDHGDRDAVDGEQALGFEHVLGPTHERQRDVIEAVAQRESDVDLVLLGERGRGDVDTGQVDALVVLQDAAGDDDRLDLVGADLGDREREVAVVEQDLVADLHVAHERRIGRRHALLVADHRGIGGDRELGARLELDLTRCKPAHADLRSLQVQQRGDRLAASICLGANDLQHPRVILVTAV